MAQEQAKPAEPKNLRQLRGNDSTNDAQPELPWDSPFPSDGFTDSPFLAALHSQRPVHANGASDPTANAVFIGPAIDLTPSKPLPQSQLKREADLIKSWRRYDWDRFQS
jgi:hypothetical protein